MTELGASEKSWEEEFMSRFYGKDYLTNEIKRWEIIDFIVLELQKARQELLTQLLDEMPKDTQNRGWNACNQEWRILLESKKGKE